MTNWKSLIIGEVVQSIKKNKKIRNNEGIYCD